MSSDDRRREAFKKSQEELERRRKELEEQRKKEEQALREKQEREERERREQEERKRKEKEAQLQKMKEAAEAKLKAEQDVRKERGLKTIDLQLGQIKATKDTLNARLAEKNALYEAEAQNISNLDEQIEALTRANASDESALEYQRTTEELRMSKMKMEQQYNQNTAYLQALAAQLLERQKIATQLESYSSKGFNTAELQQLEQEEKELQTALAQARQELSQLQQAANTKPSVTSIPTQPSKSVPKISDPFASPNDDPFSSSKGNDLFASSAASTNDPFATSTKTQSIPSQKTSDPFATTSTSDPFASNADPFASNADPFADDPFANPGESNPPAKPTRGASSGLLNTPSKPSTTKSALVEDDPFADFDAELSKPKVGPTDAFDEFNEPASQDPFQNDNLSFDAFDPPKAASKPREKQPEPALPPLPQRLEKQALAASNSSSSLISTSLPPPIPSPSPISTATAAAAASKSLPQTPASKNSTPTSSQPPSRTSSTAPASPSQNNSTPSEPTPSLPPRRYLAGSNPSTTDKGKSDPFASDSKADPFASDSFASSTSVSQRSGGTDSSISNKTSKPDPFASSTAKSDPFASNDDDPFKTPAIGKSDPFASISIPTSNPTSDPFASHDDPFASNADPFASGSNNDDPFASAPSISRGGLTDSSASNNKAELTDPFASSNSIALTQKSTDSEVTSISNLRVKAVTPFDGSNEGDLNFKEGEIITVLTQIDANWWFGTLPNDQSGIFPTTFVEPIPGDFTVRAIYQYEASQPGDVGFEIGDLLTVTSQHSSGWYEGIHLKTGQKGIFPSTYVFLFSSVAGLLLTLEADTNETLQSLQESNIQVLFESETKMAAGTSEKPGYLFLLNNTLLTANPKSSSQKYLLRNVHLLSNFSIKDIQGAENCVKVELNSGKAVVLAFSSRNLKARWLEYFRAVKVTIK